MKLFPAWVDCSTILLVLMLAQLSSAQRLTRYVDPFIGTGGTVIEVAGAATTYDKLKGQNKHSPFGGLTHPGACLPFGMIQLGPDLNTGGFQWVNGYNAYDSSVMGFSHMHTSGNGAAFGVFLLMPSIGSLQLDAGSLENPDAGFRSRFSKKNEKAEPGYYQVFLSDTRINVELTATDRVGFHRYKFPRSDSAFILLDLKHGQSTSVPGADWDDAQEVSLNVVNDSLITGFKRSLNSSTPIYFAAAFSKPFKSFGVRHDSILDKAPATKGKAITAFFRYETSVDETIMVKMAVSAVSENGALSNLKFELPHWDFDRVRMEADSIWNRQLSKVQVTGGTENQKKIFYTALYHTMLAPFLYCDVDGKYPSSDGLIHSREGFTNYTFFSLWDTYRAEHPLLNILHPERVDDMINSMLAQAQYDSAHLLPIWSVAGKNYHGMVGYPAMSVITEAYMKGFRGFDASKAYSYMKENAMADDYGLIYYKTLGYVPTEREDQSVAKTLEYAYNDWCVAQLANQLNLRADYRYFMRRSENAKNVFDADITFMRGKNAGGYWRTPFNPRDVSHYKPGEDFIEANAWQYTFSMQHNIPGLIKLMGGRLRFINKLDSLFETSSQLTGSYSADVSGLIGQYAAGNEQCNHVAYLYNYAGQSWKTQKWLHYIMTSQYNATSEGIPGNDDAGQLSAWYVFNAMGFYPVNPVDGMYNLGTPLFDTVTIDVGNGHTFRIAAHNVSDKSYFIASSKLNGVLLKTPRFSHKQLLKGGCLEFEMSSVPSK